MSEFEEVLPNAEYEEPLVGGWWEARDEYPGGRRAYGQVVDVTSAFVSLRYGPQEPTVIFFGTDSFGLPLRVAYKLSQFYESYHPVNTRIMKYIDAR